MRRAPSNSNLLQSYFYGKIQALSLESVDAMYSDMSLKAWQSNKWVPEGYIDRKTRDQAFWQRRGSVLDDSNHHQSGGNGVLAKEGGEKTLLEKDDHSPMRRSENVHGDERQV